MPYVLTKLHFNSFEIHIIRAQTNKFNANFYNGQILKKLLIISNTVVREIKTKEFENHKIYFTWLNTI